MIGPPITWVHTSEFNLLVTSNPLEPTLDNNSEVHLTTYVDTWKIIHNRYSRPKMWRGITLIANICVNIVLLIMYAQFFGQHSIRKYLEGNIIVVTNEERKSIITAPGKIFIKHNM